MDNIQKKSKFLLRNIALFFLASFIPKTLSFFMVPLYTHCLTTEQYGNIDLITTTVQLILPILTLQVQDAVLYFSMGEKEAPAKVLSTGLWIVTGGFVILLIGTAGILAFGFVELSWAYIVFFVAHYLISAITNVVGYFARAIDKVKSITVASIITCVITLGCNLLFLLVFRWGVNGYLLANILGHFISLLYLCISIRIGQFCVVRVSDVVLVKKIVAFSIPMIVSALAWWVNNSLDKYILTYFCGVSAAGLLAVAYKIPTIISLLGTTISKAFSVSVLKDFNETDEDGFLGQSYAMISFLMVLCSSGLILVNIPVSKFLFANDFFVAWQLVPPLLVSATMNHMSLFCQNICIAMGRTKLISRTAIVGAVMNTFLNFCMIPTMGAYGAAVATAIGFFIVWLARYLWVKKHVKLKNSGFKETVSYITLGTQMVLAYWGNRYIVLQLLGCIILVLLYWKECMNILKRILKRNS